MAGSAKKRLQSLGHAEAGAKGDLTSGDSVQLALLCLDRVNAVPERDDEGWTTRMSDLWQLAGIDQGAQYRRLDCGWVSSSYKVLARRLHPDKLNIVLNNESCTLPARTKVLLSGLWSRVQQKYEECQRDVLGGPPSVAPITNAGAIDGWFPHTGRCIDVFCDAVGTDIPLDEVHDMPGRTIVRLYLPGENGDEDTKCIPMDSATGLASVTLSQWDYPWLFCPWRMVSLRIERTDQFSGVQEMHVDLAPTSPKPSRGPHTVPSSTPRAARNRDGEEPDERPSSTQPKPSRAPHIKTAVPESDAAQTRRQRLAKIEGELLVIKGAIDSLPAAANGKIAVLEHAAPPESGAAQKRRKTVATDEDKLRELEGVIDSLNAGANEVSTDEDKLRELEGVIHSLNAGANEERGRLAQRQDRWDRPLGHKNDFPGGARHGPHKLGAKAKDGWQIR